MFGFGKIEVFPVSFQDGHITFRTPKKIGVGKSVKVKLLLAGQDGPTVSLKITEMDENLDDFTGVGLIKERQKKIDALTFQMALAGVKGACRRVTKRVAATIRLRSRQLPNYRGITANVNETGVEINTDGPLPAGTKVTLEFDVPEMADLNMQAVSIWSTDGPVIGKGTYRAGVEFPETDRATLDAWSAFYRRVLESEGASVMMKTMGDGGDASGNYNTRESGQQTTVLESDKVQDETKPQPETPPTPSFQPPTPTSTPSYQPPAPTSTPSFQPPTQPPTFPSPTSAPNFAPPSGNPPFPPAPQSPPTFSPPAASQPPPFQAPSAPTFDFSSTPTFPGSGASPSAPSFQAPQAPSGPPGFSPPGHSGAPSFNPPGQVPSFGAPSPPRFEFSQPATEPAGPSYGGSKTPKPPQSLRLDTDSQAKPPAPFQPPGGSVPQFQAPKPPSASPPTFGSAPTPSFGPPPPPPSFGQPPAPPFGQSTSAPFGAGQSASGFQPPPPPPGASFQPPPATPERVVPVKMSGPSIMFRCREGHRYQNGSQTQVELVFQFQGQTNSVVVRVQISGVQAEQDGTFSCIGMVHEDAQKIQVLNQVIGS